MARQSLHIRPAGPRMKAWRQARSLVAAGTLAMVGAVAQAAFLNGDFEAGDLTGWTPQAWTNNGTQANPKRLSELRLQPPGTKSHLVEIASGSESAADEVLFRGDAGQSALKLTLAGSHSARINLKANSATPASNVIPRSSKVTGGLAGWTQQVNTASSITQEVTLTADDIDQDGKIHIRFVAAPVLEYASNHGGEDRPYFAISLVKTYDAQTSTDLTGSPQELFFKYHYGGEPGAPWKTFTDKGGAIQNYTDPQAYDVAPGNAYLRVGDKVRLQAVASACSAGGHAGHLYVDNFGTTLPKTLWISASGPVSAPKADGTEITYTYTYTNNGSTPVNNVKVTPAMPVGTDAGISPTTFVSLAGDGGACTAPAVGSSDPAQCDFGTLAPGQSGTFTMTVKVPLGTPSDQINNGNYTIGGDLTSTLLGAMVQTQLLAPAASSDMVPDVSGLPPAAVVGVPYTGSFSCKNDGAASAGQAICDASGLPPGVTAGQCTIDGAAWMQPGVVPAGKTVVCQVSGTPTGPGGSSTITVTTGGDNDLTPGNNTTTSNIAVTTTPDMQINLSGLPPTSPLNIPYSGSFTCSNQGLANAVSGTSCAVTGLPAGVTQGACSISPGNAAWVAGNAVPVGATVTCQVSGTPTAAGSSTVTGTTGATDDSNAANNTATMNVSTVAVPDMGVDLSGLPTAFTAGTPYSGSFVCKNLGSVDASAGTSCAVTGLPSGVSQGACRISPANAAWSAGDAVPAGASVTCTVSGTPSSVGAVTLTGSTGATGDANPANNTASRAVAGAVSPASIPTLSEWGLILMSGLMGIMGWGMARRRRANPL